MTKILNHVKANVVAYLALFVALGGTSYAAFSLPPGSVGSRQLKNRAVTAAKLNPTSIAASVRAWANLICGSTDGACKHRALTFTFTTFPSVRL